VLVGEKISFSTETYSVPPEALKWTTNQGSERRLVFKDDLVVRTSIDVWAFGQVAYEALVGQPLFPGESGENDEMDPLKVILQWSDANLVEVKRELERIGIIEPGIELIRQCLSPNEDTRPQIDSLLQHTFWSQC
jgi:serine/threonine protein kinase